VDLVFPGASASRPLIEGTGQRVPKDVGAAADRVREQNRLRPALHHGRLGVVRLLTHLSSTHVRHYTWSSPL
jgi:hypothetical protein